MTLCTHAYHAEIHRDHTVTCYGCGKRLPYWVWNGLAWLRTAGIFLLLLVSCTAGIVVSRLVARWLGWS